MNRRKFLRSSTALGSLMLFSQAFFNVVPGNRRFKGRIIIVGAGVSGLYAADLLMRKGCEVCILEASWRIGGRIKQDTTFAGKPIDLGAQWIHGKSEIYTYARQVKTSVYKDDLEKYVRINYNNQLSTEFPEAVKVLMQSLADRKAVIGDVSLFDYIASQNYDEHIIRFCEFLTTDAATQSRNISAREVAKLIDKFNSGEDFQFSDTTFFQFIESNIPPVLKNIIHFNTIVTGVDYTGDQIKVYDQHGGVRECDKILITVPISMLNQNKIQFVPALPDSRCASMKAIGMDKGLKMFIKFDHKFYDYGIVNGRHAAYYIDGTKKGYIPDKGLLASLIMGRYAEEYYEDPEKSKEKIIDELDEYYDGQATKYVEGFHVQDWGNEPFIEGTYSYAKAGLNENRVLAQQPLKNKLYFAGEAFNNEGNNGTVHGAMETAVQAVTQIISR